MRFAEFWEREEPTPMLVVPYFPIANVLKNKILCKLFSFLQSIL